MLAVIVFIIIITVNSFTDSLSLCLEDGNGLLTSVLSIPFSNPQQNVYVSQGLFRTSEVTLGISTQRNGEMLNNND